MTCICGQEFFTSAPIQPDPAKKEPWLCAGVTIGLIWAIAIAISVAFYAFQKHPRCVAEQDRLSVQCHPCWRQFYGFAAGVQGVRVCGEQELEPEFRWLKESESLLLQFTLERRQECTRCDTLREELMTRALRDCSTRHTIAYVYGLVTGGGGGGGVADTAGAGAATGADTGTTGGSKGNKQPVSMTTESISVVLASR